MRKFLKNWGTLAVAIIAVVASVCALYIDHQHLELQQTQYEDAIERQESRDQELDEQHKQAVVKQEARNQQLDKQFERAMKIASDAVQADIEHYDVLKKEFEDTIAPHIRHEEVYDHVSHLYDRLVLYRDWVGDLQYAGLYNEYNVVYPYYRKASDNFCKAEEQLRDGNFEQAMKWVATAYISLAEGTKAYEEATAAVE